MLLKAEATTATLCAGYTKVPPLGRLVVIVLLSPRSTSRLSGRLNCYETLVSRGSEKAGVKIAALTESSSLSFQNIGKSEEKLRKKYLSISSGREGKRLHPVYALLAFWKP